MKRKDETVYDTGMRQYGTRTTKKDKVEERSNDKMVWAVALPPMDRKVRSVGGVVLKSGVLRFGKWAYLDRRDISSLEAESARGKCQHIKLPKGYNPGDLSVRV